EFLALAASLEHLGSTFDNARAKMLAKALDQANGKFLDSNKSPSRKVGELDNRGSHFYLALYWAEALAEQNEDTEMKELFGRLTAELKAKETTILDELNSVQGKPTDIRGYYHPDHELTGQVMRPSKTLNETLALVAKG
ncbi:MAG TPA: NADP-dependent isocitrate dehydrogenase, partial [Halomonas sp.]|nr:NADP-dependent isocitrate dehydrogenase [Halomonas sp.]